MSTDDGRKKLEEEFRAMESPEKKEAFVRAKNKIFTKQINEEKVKLFSDYLTKVFIDTCNDKTIAGRFSNWDNRTDDYKIDLAYDIVNLFMQKIKDDILNNNVTIYTHSGEVFNTTNDLIDKNYKQDIISAIKEIKVTKNTDQYGFMETSNNGDISINTNIVLYKDSNSAIFFLMDLRHEITHLIDIIVPNISPLDPEIRMMAIRYYEGDDHDLYQNNPLELSANMKRKEYRIKIEAMLNDQEQIMSNNIQKQDYR